MIVCQVCGNINFCLSLSVLADLKTSNFYSTVETSYLAFEVRCSCCGVEVLDTEERQQLLKTLLEKKEIILEEK